MRYLFVLLTIVISGCYRPIVRDKTVYKHELHFLEMVNTKSMIYLHNWFKMTCRCNIGKFSAIDCVEIAKMLYVLEHRVPYHIHMMKYLSGLSSNKPSDPKPWDESEYCKDVTVIDTKN